MDGKYQKTEELLQQDIWKIQLSQKQKQMEMEKLYYHTKKFQLCVE